MKRKVRKNLRRKYQHCEQCEKSKRGQNEEGGKLFQMAGGANAKARQRIVEHISGMCRR